MENVNAFLPSPVAWDDLTRALISIFLPCLLFFSEHFCDPTDKSHPKFSRVADTVMTLYSAADQMSGEPAKRLTIGDAVTKGTFILFGTYNTDYRYIGKKEKTV